LEKPTGPLEPAYLLGNQPIDTIDDAASGSSENSIRNLALLVRPPDPGPWMTPARHALEPESDKKKPRTVPGLEIGNQI
jgi:hypothetical protein